MIGCRQSTSHLPSYHYCTSCTVLCMSRVEANSYFSQSIASRASVSLDGGWQDASVVSIRYPGNCGIFAFCTEEGCLVARVVQRVHYVVFISALLDLLPDFPVLGIVAVVAATLVSSSPPNMLSRRRQPCAAPSIIATVVQADRTDRKVCACRYNTAAKQASTPPTQ